MSIFEVVRQSVTIRQAALLLAQDFSIDVLPEHHLKFCGGNKTKKSSPTFTDASCSAILKTEKERRDGNGGQADLCWILPTVR